MEKARIAIFEEDSDIQDILDVALVRNGHTIVHKASTVAEARDFIAGLEDRSFDVAIVDGNLNERDLRGGDGADITQLLRQKLGAITVIGLLGRNPIEGADFNVNKVSWVTSINAIIREL